MSIPEETIEAIRARADIVAVISRHVTLKQRGRNFVGLCPFHAEKTPSFNVLPERQIWRCFGCGVGGDVFSFLRRIDGLSFVEAVERLAGQTGVEIERDPRAAERRSQRQQVLDLNRTAAEWYAQQLARSAPAMEFVRRRGLSGESVAALGLGFAPAEWDALSNTMLRRGVPGALLEQAGLSHARETGGYYDLFRDRVVFPIRDVEGRVLGFGGRALGDVQPKYLNSPETMVFDKGRTLYGLDRARRAIADAGVAIVVEGYMDAAMVQQEGVLNVVATLGTALRATHLELLRRYAPRVVLAYDGDAAGAAAAERSLALFEEAEMDGRILILPEGRDPDDFIRNRGAEAFRRLAEEALPLVEFQLRRLTGRADGSTPEGRAALARAVAPVLAGIRSAVKREEYVSRLAEQWCAGRLHRVGEIEAAIRREVQRPGGAARARAATAGQPERTPTVEVPKLPGVHPETVVLQGLWHEVENSREAYNALSPDDFSLPAQRRLAAIIWEGWSAGKPAAAARAAARAEDEVMDLVSRLELEQERLPVVAKTVSDSLRAIKEKKLRARISQLQDSLMRPDLVSAEEYSRIAHEKRELVTQLSDIVRQGKLGFSSE
ncbi:MAG: DNA primase [Armatimonadetes bacterium]|nr:DNA primase [Armatimonadota bacterium]